MRRLVRSGAVGWLSCAAVAVACGGGALPPRETPSRAQPSASAETFVAFPLIEPLIQGGVIVPEGADADWSRLVIAGFRLERRGEEELVSREVAPFRFREARSCGDGFVFASDDSTVLFYAAQFTGELVPIASLPAELHWRVHVFGDTVVAHAFEGVAFHGRCGSPLVRAEPVPRESVEALWGRGTRRLALVGGGDVYASDDSGASWTRIDVGAFVPEGLDHDGNLRGGGGEERSVGADGRLGPPVRSAPSSGIVFSSTLNPGDDDRERLVSLTAMVLARSPTLRRSLCARRERVFCPTPDRVVVVASGGGVVAYEAGRARRYPAAFDGHECTLQRVGARVLARCDDGYRWSEDGISFGPPRVDEDASDGPSWGDGARVLTLGTCDGRPDPEDRLYCWRDHADGSHAELAAPARSSVVAVRGTEALLRADDALWYSRDGGPFVPIEWVRLESGTSVRLTGGSLLVIVGPPERGEPNARSVVSVAPLDSREVQRIELPEGAVAIGFVDRAFGVAFGRTIADTWSTRDLGRTWSRVAHTIDGDASAVRAALEATSSFAECDERGCSYGGLRVERAGATERLRGSAAPIVLSRPSEAPRAVSLLCEVGARAPVPALAARGDAPPYDLRRPWRWASPAYTLAMRARGPERAFEWTGADEGGAYRARSRWMSVAHFPSELSSCEPRMISRERAIVTCCGQDECISLLAAANESPGIFVESVDQALIAPSGSMAIARDHLRYTHTVVVDARGRALAHRTLRFSLPARGTQTERAEPLLALEGSAPSLFVARSVPGLSAASVVPLEGGPARPIDVAPISRVCGDGESGLEVGMPVATFSSPVDEAVPRRELVADVLLRADASCVRRVRLRRRTSAHFAGRPASLRAENGLLVGYADTLSGERLALRCSVAADEPAMRASDEVDDGS